MLKEATSVFHASDGAAYEQWLGRWSSRLANPFLDFAKFPDDGQLLDVGCGTGSLAMAMAKRWPGRPVVGVDRSPEYISYAQSRRTGDQPSFETRDACALAYQNGQFAGVAAQLLFLFIPKPVLALREMARVARPGGTVAAAVWDSRGGLVFQRMMFDTAVAIDPDARLARDSLFANPVAIPGGLAGFFSEAGIKNIETGSITIRMDYESFEDYWGSFQTGQGPVGVYFANLTPDQSARIREAVRDAYCSGAPDGPRSLAATALAVRGTAP